MTRKQPETDAPKEPDGRVDVRAYVDVLAPLPEVVPWTELDALAEVLAGVHPHGTERRYHGYVLTSVSVPAVGNTWRIARPNENGGETPIEVVNPAAFECVTDLQVFLDELVALAPASRAEWVAHKRSDFNHQHHQHRSGR